MQPGRKIRLLAWVSFVITYLALALPGSSQDNLPDQSRNTPKFQIVVVPPGQSPKFLEKNIRDAFVPMSLQEFEKLRKTSNFKSNSLKSPVLAQANYKAEFKDNALIGKANWVFNSSTKSQGYFPIQPFNLAIKKASWNSKDALLGEFIPGSAVLMIPENNDSSCELDWTHKIEQYPDGYHVSLRIPPASLQSFELSIPFNWNFVLDSKGSVEVGPPVPSSNKKILKVIASGETKIDLLLQDPAQHGRLDELRVEKLQAKHDVTPESTASDFIFHFNGLTNGSRVLEFDLDDDLKILEVLSDQIESWRTVTRENLPLLEITLKNNLCRPDKVLVRAVASSVIKKTFLWKTPWVRFKSLTSHREEITVVTGQEIRIDDVILGDFLLADIGNNASKGTVFSFIGGSLASQKTRVYPAVKVSMGNARFRTHQEILFQPTPIGASLQANISYFPLNGSTSSLFVQLPTGWEVEQLTISPDTQVKDWSVLQSQGRQLLRVELENPLAAVNSKNPDAGQGRPSILSLRLSPEAKIKKTLLWGFPSILPLNSILNEGYFGIQYDASSYQAKVKSDLLELEIQNESQQFKWPCNHLFKFVENTPAGSIELNQIPGVSNLRFNSMVTFLADRMETRLDVLLGSENGQVESFDLICPAGSNPSTWKWTVSNRGSTFKKIERVNSHEIAWIISGLSPMPGLKLYGLSELFPHGECWRFHLFQSLGAKESINFQAIFTRPLPVGYTEVPLVGFPSGQQVEATVQIDSTRNRNLEFRTRGLKSIASTKPRLKNFSYDFSNPWIEIKNLQQLDLVDYGTIEKAVLRKSLLADGAILNQLSLGVREWNNDFLEIGLPEKSQVSEIRVNDILLSNFIFNGNRVRIPSSTSNAFNDVLNQFVITYLEDAPAGWLWKKIDSNYPQLPSVPLDKFLYWTIPSGVEPIASAKIKPIGRIRRGKETEGHLGYMFPLNYLLDSKLFKFDNSRDVRGLLQTILQQKPIPNAMDNAKFNDLVKSLQIYLLKNGYSLVLDDGCGEIKNINPASNLPNITKTISENLDLLGLKLVPVANFVLLTNLKEGEFIREMISPNLVQALGEAVTNGKDFSNRYVSAWSWLLNSRIDGSLNPNNAMSQDANDSGANLWQVYNETDPIFLVDHHHAQALGFVLAFVLLVLVANKPFKSISYLEPLMGMLAGLAICWMPPPLVPLAWWFFLFWVIKKVLQFASFIACSLGIQYPMAAFSPPVKAASLILLTVFFFNDLSAQNANSFDVYLLAEPESSKREPIYLVPQALIKQFRENMVQVPEGKAFITKAQYEGVVQDNGVNIKATWNVYSTGQSSLELPVSGGWLADKIYLNGMQAFPTTKPNGVLSLTIPKGGEYVLTVGFKGAISEKFSDRTVSFSIPSSPITFFQCDLPSNAEQPMLTGNLGATMVVRSGNTTRLSADLGKVSGPLNLRWSKGPLPPKTKPIIQEAYIWDISLDSSSLQAYWNLQFPESGTDFFEIDLPADLIPSGINPITLQGGGFVNLLDWNLKPNASGQRMTLYFSRRISGSLQIQAVFIPMRGFSSRWQVPVPTPVGVFQEGGSFLAYKSTNCNVSRQILPLRLTGINARNFASFWPESAKPDPELLSFAYSFRREPNNPPVLTLDISPAHFKFDANQTIKGVLQPKSSQFSINGSLKSNLPDISFVEWYLEGINKYTVTKLQGEGIQSWSQNNTKVLIWLEKPVKEFAFNSEVFATTANPGVANLIEVPKSNFLFATKLTSRILLSHDNDALVKPITLKGFTNSPDTLELIANDKNYQAQFEVKPPVLSGNANVLFWVEEKESQIVAKVDVEINRARDGGSVHEFSISGWDNSEIKPDLPLGIKLEPIDEKEYTRKWRLIIPESQKKGVINFSVSCGLGKSMASSSMKVPTWNLTGMESVSSWVAIPNESINIVNIQGLSKVSGMIALGDSPVLKKKLAGRSMDFFRVESKSWNSSYRIRKVGGALADPPMVIHNIIAGELKRNGTIGGTAVFWLYLPELTPINVRIPATGSFISCSLDDVRIYPESIGEDQIHVFKPVKTGFQRIRLSFQLPETVNRWQNFLDNIPVLSSRTRFDKTLIIGTQPFESWRMEVPALYVQKLGALENQARSLMEASRNIAKETRLDSRESSALQPIQDLFHQIISRGRTLESFTVSDEESLTWGRTMVQQNMEYAIELNYEDSRTKAELNSTRYSLNDFFNSPEKIFNQRIISLSDGAIVPDLSVTLNNPPGFQMAPFVSIIWIIFVIGVFYLSSFPGFYKIILVSWPEQLLIFGLCFYGLSGFNLLVLLCFISGLAGRIFVILFYRREFIQNLQFK